MNNTDLHCHSNFSDGILSPRELVRRAKEKGVLNLALTDHNSVEGVKEAIEEGGKIGVNIIPAVEMKFRGGEILGYFVDFENTSFKNFLDKLQKASLETTKEIYQKFNSKGYLFSFEEIRKSFPNSKNNLSWYNLCYFLLFRGFRKSLKEIVQFFFEETLFSPQKKTYSPEEIIKQIRDVGGVPVLAHPWITRTSKNLLNEPKINSLINAGLRGVEIDQGDRNGKRTGEFLDKIMAISEKYNLIITSGSDNQIVFF